MQGRLKIEPSLHDDTNWLIKFCLVHRQEYCSQTDLILLWTMNHVRLAINIVIVKFYYFLITMLGFMDWPCPGSFQKIMAKTLNLTDRLILSQPWLARGVHRGMFYKLTYFLQGPINRSQSNDCCFNCLQKRWTVFSWPQYSKNKASTVCSFTWW